MGKKSHDSQAKTGGKNPSNMKGKAQNNAAAENGTGKRKRSRGKRGGKKHKSSHVSSPTNNNNRTQWSALEKEWFDVGGNQVSEMKIPNTILVSEITASLLQEQANAENSLLRKLWHNFSKRQQRQSASRHSPQIWTPRPIQLQAWSVLLSQEPKLNVIGLSPTASGKTLAFGAPIVVKAFQQPQQNSRSATNVFGILLLPTRELCQQVAKQLEIMTASLSGSAKDNSNQQLVRVLACAGGDTQSTKNHIQLLQKTATGTQWIVSATPGRLLDIAKQMNEDSSADCKVTWEPAYIILDEADRLAINTDLGQQVTSIFDTCLKSNTILGFFSATYPHKVQPQWKTWMRRNQRKCAMIRVDAVSLETTAKHDKKQHKHETQNNDSSDNDDKADTNQNNQSYNLENDEQKRNDFLSRIPACLVQTLHVCAEHKKPRKLIHTLDKVRKEQSRQKRLGIIFFGRIKTLQYISKLLQKQSDHDCLELHSQLPQSVRNRNLQTFQAGKTPLLLATDIAARGVHVSNIHFVINYDFPGNLEQYVHRCGRAGRNYQTQKSDDNDANAIDFPPTIYSFFTRTLAPMAPDLVALLQASNAWIDPNLLELADKKVQGKGRKINAESQGSSSSNNKAGDSPAKNNDETDEGDFLSDDDDQDAFPHLSANRIVLKRASHVSDASSNDDDSDEDEED